MSKFLRKPSSKFEFGEVLADVVRDAPRTVRKNNLRPSHVAGPLDKFVVSAICCASVAFCAYAIMMSVENPEYFSEKLISSFQSRKTLDPIMTGTVVKKGEAAPGLPVPVVARKHDLKPSDYQIVMVFDGEAILATDDELMRAKVGTVLPGLGAIKEITPSGTGGTVIAEGATLQTAAP